MNLHRSFALVLATTLLSAQAAVPPVDDVGRPATIRCKTMAGGVVINAAHADKIVFELLGPLQAANAADQPVLDNVPRNNPLDIKVIDDPRTIADLKGKVLTFIGAVDNAAQRQNLRISQVLYAMVCPNVQQPAAD
jgi:hypothetical protein